MQKRFWMNKEWKVAERVAEMARARYNLVLEDWQVLKIVQAFEEEDEKEEEKFEASDTYPFLLVEKEKETEVYDEKTRRRINYCPADCYD